jgi:phosphatidylserine/phosphatidylglycerophosphate/cardiolipin synthase-like enzyme
MDRAQTSLDVAMFSHTENATGEALKRAASRGVKVRYLLDGARQAVEDHRKVDFFASLEQAGVDIRYVEPGIHHKFIIADGPRDSLAAAKAARIALGSANLSYTASAQSDENTLFLVNERKLTFKLQREFNLLWQHSVDYVSEGAQPRAPDLSAAIINDSNIPKDPDVDVFFTSSNFQSAGGKLVLNGRYAVAGEIVKAISSARYSIVVTSSFFRSRPIAEALIAKKAQSPSVIIRVLINQADFVSNAEHERQVADQAACIRRAGSDAQKLELCNDASLSYGYLAETKGIEVRYKLYAYELERPGPLMHQKYIVVDNETLLTGSYNLSYSSEHTTFEDVVMLKGTRHRSLIRDYVTKFYDLWHLGAEERQFDATMQAIQGNDVPLVFNEETNLKPMTLTRSQINAVRSAIWTGCGFGNPPVRYGKLDFRRQPITCKRRPN